MRSNRLVLLVTAILALGPASGCGGDSGDGSEPASAAGTSLAFFDAHIHLMPTMTGNELYELARSAGLEGIAILGPRDSSGFALQHPGSIVPFGFIDRDTATKELLLVQQTVDTLRQQFQAGLIRGVGEIAVVHPPTAGSPPGGDNYRGDHPILVEIYSLAASYGAPVNVHIDYTSVSELIAALNSSPSTTFIWAHAGDAPPETVAPLLAAYPNLHCDLACRHPLFERGHSMDLQSLTAADGTLEPAWRSLFEAYPNRFMFGTDIGPPGRAQIIDQVVGYFRDALGQLMPETAAKIAGGNARALFRMPQ
jgi:predicted TIM-barrel fold metal-dependent hydrolase